MIGRTSEVAMVVAANIEERVHIPSMAHCTSWAVTADNNPVVDLRDNLEAHSLDTLVAPYSCCCYLY